MADFFFGWWWVPFKFPFLYYLSHPLYPPKGKWERTFKFVMVLSGVVFVFFFQVVVFFWGVTSPPFYNTTLPYSKNSTFVIVLCILHSTWILYPQKEVDSITTSPFYGP